MARTPLKCYHCGQPFPRTSGAGLFCGSDCEADHAAALEGIRSDLQTAGFAQHAETPNLWVRDGVALAEEHVKHVGLKKALQQHESHVAGVNTP
jgi:hypothetical protein